MNVDLQSVAVALAVLAGAAAGAFAAWRAARTGQRVLEDALRREQAAHVQVRQELDSARQLLDAARDDVARLDERAKGERKAADERLAFLQQAQDTLSNQFKVLANQIFDDKSQKFADQNKTALGALLEPLRVQLSDFKGKVEEVYVQEGKDRSALAEQVRQLLTLNQALSQDAQNLTDALKGNAQVQGAWGEWVLEQMLTASGLVKDVHYTLQDTQKRDDGSRARPDSLIELPGGRRLVIDSKVSLVAYEQYANAKDDAVRASALRAHLESVKRHVTGLSAREYQKLYPTLDFVVMFIPVEPAFLLAATDKKLFTDALEQNVLVVSPSTLLFVLRTVAYIWRQESQNRNSQEIARRGALLYEKFCDFAKDLETVGDRLNQAQLAYDGAANKLSKGNGNLVSQAQKLESLGVKAAKKIPAAFVDGADTDPGVVAQLASLAASNTPRDPDSAPSQPAP
jgi:DNA recombination protein RmuC